MVFVVGGMDYWYGIGRAGLSRCSFDAVVCVMWREVPQWKCGAHDARLEDLLDCIAGERCGQRALGAGECELCRTNSEFRRTGGGWSCSRVGQGRWSRVVTEDVEECKHGVRRWLADGTESCCPSSEDEGP
jgi:hypothetical protein